MLNDFASGASPFEPPMQSTGNVHAGVLRDDQRALVAGIGRQVLRHEAARVAPVGEVEVRAVADAKYHSKPFALPNCVQQEVVHGRDLALDAVHPRASRPGPRAARCRGSRSPGSR